MLKSPLFTSQIYLRLDGAEVEQAILQKLEEVVVDQHSHLPEMFAIRLHDPDLQLLDHGPFDLGRKVEIAAENPAKERIVLIQGEITALEPRFEEGMIAELVVRGFDPSHRAYRQSRSQAFTNTKDSELAARLAEQARLEKSIDSTAIPYDHIFQHNQSDLVFLAQRARRIGYECFVAGGKLYFRKPPSPEARVTLKWGDDLLTFRPRLSLAEQVDEVIVRGWDPETQKPVVGRASQGRLYPQIGEPKDGAAWGRVFGPGKEVVVDQPVVSQAEADLLAAARLDEISGSFIEAEGTAFRRPDVRAGVFVKLESLGERFSGVYLVTSARHVYGPTGLVTTFSVRGSRTGLLAEQMAGGVEQDRWPGVVTAKVTNTADPKDWGRVKVKFPWLAEDVESDWARVMGAGAGPQAGFFALPGVGDEVLVVFEHGDFSRPFVIGGLWNGQQPIPPEVEGAAKDEKPLVRTWRSRGGHRITLFDDVQKKIEILTSGGRSITLDDSARTVTLRTQGVKITLQDRQLAIESDGEITVKAGSSLKLEANGNLDLQATGQVRVKGAQIQLN